MGIIRKLGLLLSFFYASDFSAQNFSDTVFFSGNKFVEHIVEGGESLRSIAALHKVKTSQIIEANELSKVLFYGQVLYIPIYLNNIRPFKSLKDRGLFSAGKLTSKEVVSDNSTLNIALLMPYYLLRNDTMFNIDTLDSSKRYYSQSESALSFHIGVELAIDSLRRVGYNIMLHAFDTNQDSLTVKKIISSEVLDEMDIIIGPMYSSLFQIVCKKYGSDYSKILISPLSRDNGNIKEFPSVYQISLTYKVQTDILVDYLKKNKLNERIIILNDSREEGLTSYVKYKFKQVNKEIDSFHIIDTKVDSIRRYFIESQNILLLSKDKAFVSTMLGSIGSIDSLSTVFSFESITSYDNLDISNLMEIDVHIPYSRSITLSNKNDLDFVSLFEREYSTNSSRYSKVGYDIIMHFCGNTEVYSFQQYKSGYYQNISAPIYHYIDYDLVPVE